MRLEEGEEEEGGNLSLDSSEGGLLDEAPAAASLQRARRRQRLEDVMGDEKEWEIGKELMNAARYMVMNYGA